MLRHTAASWLVQDGHSLKEGRRLSRSRRHPNGRAALRPSASGLQAAWGRVAQRRAPEHPDNTPVAPQNNKGFEAQSLEPFENFGGAKRDRTRSEERRVGKEGVSQGRSRWSA